jgi:hypothetical protein
VSKQVDTIEDLFRWGATRPMADTSLEAFDSIKDKIGKRHHAIMAYVDSCKGYGATLDEICVGCDMLVQTASARVRELVQGFELQDSGQRRHTRNGKLARVYLRKPKIESGSIAP